MPKGVLCVVQYVSCLVGIREAASLFTWYNGGIIQHVDKASGLGCKNDLLLCSLDYGGGVDIKGLFELLSSNVRELCFGHQGLSFRAYELLLKGDEFGGLWLFVLEFLDLILNLEDVSAGSCSHGMFARSQELTFAF